MSQELIGKQASAFAPASSGNVSVGFDLLGAALQPIDKSISLGDTVNVEFAVQDSMKNSGEFAVVCPEDKEQNLAWQAYQLFRKRLEDESVYPKVAMELVKRLPVGSGLGSSACSVVASLAALNKLFDFPFNQQALLHMMGEIEGGASGAVHYDNVAPSYFGGLQLMSAHQNDETISLPVPKEWYWVVAFPGFSLATKEAREVLPKQYDKSDVINNAQQLSSFVAYLFQQQNDKAAQVIKDIVAEPYRAPLIDGFVDCKQQLLNDGSLAVGISGAGPTMFVIAKDLQQAKQYQAYLESNYLKTDSGFVHICQCAEHGAIDDNVAN